MKRYTPHLTFGTEDPAAARLFDRAAFASRIPVLEMPVHKISLMKSGICRRQGQLYRALCQGIGLKLPLPRDKRERKKTDERIISGISQMQHLPKAKKWLDEEESPMRIGILWSKTPTAEEIKAWQGKKRAAPQALFNTSGLKYRELGLKDRLPQMSEEEQYALLSTDGMLVKRPIVVGDDFVLVGFRPAEWEQHLG